MQKTTPTLGPRRGQAHPHAKLTNGEVERMRQLHEEFEVGDPRYLGYKKLARIFDCPKATVRDICTYRYR